MSDFLDTAFKCTRHGTLICDVMTYYKTVKAGEVKAHSNFKNI